MRIILTNNRSGNFVFLIMAIGQQLPNLDFKMIQVFFFQTNHYLYNSSSRLSQDEIIRLPSKVKKVVFLFFDLILKRWSAF